MSSAQEFTDWCRDGMFKFQQLFARDNGRSGVTNTAPRTKPDNTTSESKDSTKQRNNDEKLNLKCRLPFNSKNPSSSKTTRVKDEGKVGSDPLRQKDTRNSDTVHSRVEGASSTDMKHDVVPDGKTTSRSDAVDPLPIRDSSSRPSMYSRHFSSRNLMSVSKYDAIAAPQQTVLYSPYLPRMIQPSPTWTNDTDANDTDKFKEIDRLPTTSNPFIASRAQTDGTSEAFLGKLHFEFAFSFDKKCFTVHLIRGENIGGHEKVDNNMNFYAVLYLMPGTMQIQTSTLKKHTKDPHFDEQFVFTPELTLQDLRRLSLQMKVYNNLPMLTDAYIGGIGLPLGKYDLTRMTRLCRNIEQKVSLQRDIGHVFVSLNLNTARKKLTVKIGRVTRLTYHPISGAPNPYVSVEVSQDFSFIVKKRSKSLKKTTFPTFNYTVTFDLANASPETIDLTHLIVTVRSDEHDRSDAALGEVRLGYDSSENSEIQHWNEVKRCPGQAIGKWHYLMESEEPFE